MGIKIGETKAQRDWGRIASDGAEAVIQAIALGTNGFSNAISALLRGFQGLRGNDTVELRATRLIFETLSYATSATMATSHLGRKPLRAEAEEIIRSFIARADILANQNAMIFEIEHIENPASFPLFSDAEDRIYHALKPLNPKEPESDIAARFRTFVSEGLNRIRTKAPDYFSSVMDALTGPDALSDARVRAWDQYRARLIQRFEDEPLFGEEPITGVTVGQVYQPLRAWWDEDVDEERLEISNEKIGRSDKSRKVRRHVGMLDTLILDWLNEGQRSDRVRLISGGPGSGKSTFAKHIAAVLAREPRWRIVFVPLQRLKGTGPLESRIDDYFRLQLDEPFDADTAPLISLGRDGHRDWLVIFDGLDELSKEGTSSESAAQDFASALADWRGRVGPIAIRFLVLGRVPSMQEARRRLGLYGEGRLYVADMIPLEKKAKASTGHEITIIDSNNLQGIDQRPEFWARWAAAKGLPLDPPQEMKASELLDLTKEPLLAYLLILSGYVGDRWQEAAENRNRIYQAIFDHIWDRERTKPTRIHLNDLGQEGFEILMQALGLAAWRGGGRTGDEATFTAIRDTFMRPGLLAKAKACGAADLSNVALLFYTRKDEEGGRGYEFLHKSFGEYLTARGLLNAFQRWGDQVDDPTLDFDATEFLRRWLKLAAPTPMTREILTFLRNEARLQAWTINPDCFWEPARKWVRTAEHLVDEALKNGLPAHEAAAYWRAAEVQERNAEESLLGLLDACARAAYPSHLRNVSSNNGGWEAGPVCVPFLESSPRAFDQFVARISLSFDREPMFVSVFGATFGSTGPLTDTFSRLSLRHIHLFGRPLANMDFEGANLRGAILIGSAIMGTKFFGANMNGADLQDSHIYYSKFDNADLSRANFSRAKINHTTFENADLSGANFEAANIDSRAKASIKEAKGGRLTKRRRKTRKAA